MAKENKEGKRKETKGKERKGKNTHSNKKKITIKNIFSYTSSLKLVTSAFHSLI